MGGNDQWGNILAGADLTRRIERKIIHALTFPLITTADGSKMGKTNRGAIWLDHELTSPYEYYQYWVNIDDRDVRRFLSYFTFLPMHEIEELSRLKGANLRKAKDTLAYEATKICHGQEAANKARSAARHLFSQKDIKDIEAIPTYFTTSDDLGKGIEAYILFKETGLCKTRGEARRLISQKGAYINGKRVPSFEKIVGPDDIRDNIILLRAGKKNYLKVHIQDS
jgi:tyrosyl-tRNA synthetase